MNSQQDRDVLPPQQNIHRQLIGRPVQSALAYFDGFVMSLRSNIIAWLLVWLCGCSVATQEPILPATTEVNLPAVGIFYQQSENQLANWCLQQDNECQLMAVDLNLIARQLENTGLFPLVTQNPGADYEFLLAGVQDDKQIIVDVLLAWQGIPLTTYQYRVPRERQSSFIAEFSKDLQLDVLRDDVFSSGYLAKTLKADDYASDLQVPSQVASFHLSHRLIYNDPFQGSVLTYHNPEFKNDRIEVSIYPIPSSNITDMPTAIAEETDKLRSNLVDFAKQHKLPPLSMTANTAIKWTQQGRQYQGFYLDASILSADTEPFYAAYFFFVEQDKIVRFTTTFPSELAINFVKETLPQMQVPAESVFMAKLRRP
ncbi:hypothetical protein KJY73_10070 [Bowmanella sp. Y26]|uniref:hypothetical protein n=1 Tax=Bowmanella yangjiangensis TaxID=2811230 RepID=UPI001BDD942C|nr:hypothetical protein [Bowmanella yangjiangensis]MBT1063920.1 hypothetical protein [Bowmanella yangjiangensis]